MGMKMDDDFGPDRGFGFETDDEENQASRGSENGDDSESDYVGEGPSRNSSNYCIDNHNHHTFWPQSYRKSMDLLSVTPPTVNFLGGSSLTKISGSFLSSAYKRPQAVISESTLNKPLIYSTSVEEEEVPTSKFPAKLSATSCSGLSFSELPQEGQCSFSQSLLNVINALCGIGLLSTPYALKGGWWSLLLLVIMGVMTCYTGILLKKCLDSSPGLRTYPDIGQAAFGVTGRVFLAVILYLELYTSCVEFLIMMADNLTALFPNTHMDFAGVHLEPGVIFAVTSTLIILPTVWLRNLSLLSYISVGGVIASLLLSLCLLWVGVIDQVGFRPSGKALDLGQLPVTIGLLGFSFGGHSVFPNIYSSMKDKSKYPLVLIISFVGSLLLCAGVAICGFLMFGDKIESQFTLNMPKEFAASKFAAWTTVVNPVTKYALTITPIAFSLEELLPSARLRSSYAVSVLIRTALVISTLVVALVVPYFEIVMALMGSLLVMLVAVVIPCVCYLSIVRDKVTKVQIFVCGLIIMVGLACSVVGTYSAIQSAINKIV